MQVVSGRGPDRTLNLVVVMPLRRIAKLSAIAVCLLCLQASGSFQFESESRKDICLKIQQVLGVPVGDSMPTCGQLRKLCAKHEGAALEYRLGQSKTFAASTELDALVEAIVLGVQPNFIEELVVANRNVKGTVEPAFSTEVRPVVGSGSVTLAVARQLWNEAKAGSGSPARYARASVVLACSDQRLFGVELASEIVSDADYAKVAGLDSSAMSELTQAVAALQVWESYHQDLLELLHAMDEVIETPAGAPIDVADLDRFMAALEVHWNGHRLHCSQRLTLAGELNAIVTVASMQNDQVALDRLAALAGKLAENCGEHEKRWLKQALTPGKKRPGFRDISKKPPFD